MKYKAGIILTALLAGGYALTPTTASAHDMKCNADSITGTWLTEAKDAKIDIYKSGKAFFGKIVWLKEPNAADGKPKTDKNNPKERLRAKPLMGLVNVKSLAYDGDCKWHDGSIYDPKTGKTYSANAELERHGQLLDLRGYVGISLFGKTTTWSRIAPAAPAPAKKK